MKNDHVLQTLGKKPNLWMLLQANKSILCMNQVRIQNIYWQFRYEQWHISAKTAVTIFKILTTNKI